MTDITGEPIQPAPDIAAPPQETAAPEAELDAAPPEAEEPAAERVLPEIEPAIGETRRRILDEFLDSDRAELSMSEIKALLPDVLPGTVEAGVRREWQQGRLKRTKPGVYKLAPSRPPEPSKPSAPPPSLLDDEATWIEALERWALDRASWDVEKLGPRPGAPGCRLPMLIEARFVDRLRKRNERAEARAEAVRQRAAADRELRDRLLAGCFGNHMDGPGLQDLAPVRAMLADGVPLAHVLIGLKRTVDRRIDPRAAPIASWRDERFLRAVARCALLEGLMPRLIESWSRAGMPAPQVTTAAPAATPAR